jgi:predicted ATP-grasp superfamily ATP-dependent carboligase
MRALIVEDGYSRQALAAARALRAAGWSVGIASPIPGFSAVSRAVTRWHRIPAPEDGLAGFGEALAAVASEAEYDIVFPARDADVFGTSIAREAVMPMRVPYPAHEQVVAAFDKLNLGKAAERVGIAVPDTADDGLPATHGEGRVVKARLHPALDRDGSSARMEAQVAGDDAEAEDRVRELRAVGRQPIVQEHVDGELMSLTLLLDRDGRVIARAQQVAERRYPRGAGVDARSRTVPIDEELVKKATALLSDLGWFGLAHLEFLVPEDGRPRLIDFNGRIYGSLALAVAAGVNFPVLWAQLATGRPVERRVDATPGIRYQWLAGDLLGALTETERSPGLEVLGAVRSARGSVHSVASFRDPRPALRFVRLMLGRHLSRALPRPKSGS